MAGPGSAPAAPSLAGFDPDAAAAAWLERLNPHLLQASVALSQAAHLRWAVDLALSLMVCWLLARSGLLDRLQSALERERPRPWLVSAACAALLAAVLTVAGGLLETSPPLLLQMLGVNVLAAVLLVPLLLALVRRSPGWWWVSSGALAALLIFAAVWLPYALASGPAALPRAPEGPARAGLVQLIHEAHLPAQEVYVSPSAQVDADVTGVAGRARVVVTGGMLQTASPAEMRASVGHLMGHFAHMDQLGLGVLLALLTLVGLWLSSALFRPAAKLMGAGASASPADPAALPVLAALLIAWMALTLPVRNGYVRAINVGADQYSLDHAHEPDGLALSLVKAWNGDDPDPPALEQVLFYDHPPLKDRLRHAMAWKAAHAR